MCNLPGRLASPVLAVILSFLALACSHATAADEPPEHLQSAPLKISNRLIVTLNGPLAGNTASGRVANSTQRIENAIRNSASNIVTFKDVEDGRATSVMINDKPVFLISPIDIDEQAGETTQIVAREASARLTTAIVEWREQRTWRYLGIATAWSIGATIVYAFLVWALVRLTRRGSALLYATALTHLQKMPFGRAGILDIGYVWKFLRGLLLAFSWLVAIILTVFWLTFVLERFPYTRPWGEELEGNLSGLLAEIILKILGALPNLFLVVVIFFIARALIRISSGVFRRVESGELTVSWLDAETVKPTQRISNVVVCLFALVMAYPYLPGADSDAFKGLSVLVGVMVSLGGASVIGQAFSGLILMYIKVFRKGDYVSIGDSAGVVIDLGMFTTRIRTGTGEEIILPNSNVMSNKTINHSSPLSGNGYIVDTTVTIGYATPWRQVESMLLEAVDKVVDIVKSPLPVVRQTALSDFYVEYRLIANTIPSCERPRIAVLDELHRHIQDAFNRYGVQIMSPHYEADPEKPQVIPPEDWYPAPARKEDGAGKG